MVKGLDTFRDHFREFHENYTLIGGTACDLAMEAFGEPFRATKDLDIVLSIEALNAAFVETFWEFIQRGEYSNRQNSTGKRLFYRFSRPKNLAFPFMLELLSRLPESLSQSVAGHLTPIPVDEGLSNLSAILLDDVYYHFILAGRRVEDGISFLAPEYLIPLKVKAWQDLSEKRRAGAAIPSAEIKKHRNDVFRLFRIVVPDTDVELPDALKRSLREFLASAAASRIDSRQYGYGGIDQESLLNEIGKFYSLDRR